MKQPESQIGYKDLAFQRLQRKMQVTKECYKKRESDPTFALDLPYEIGLKLTNRCNLRCTHCFQWDENGYHNELEKTALSKRGDLDIEIIENLLNETKEIKSLLYIWGGEPMFYSYWNRLVELLEKDPRQAVLCTNGLYIKKELDSLVRISKGLTTLISVEGLKEEHDKLRGKGTFEKTIDNVKALISAQQEGLYEGYISIAGVLSNDLIPKLYETCLFFEDLGIDTLYFNYPWFITDEDTCKMDNFFIQNFSYIGQTKSKKSWHSFDFHVDPELIPILKEQLKLISSKTWGIRIRFQPDLDDEDLKGFIEGSDKPVQNRTRCLSISNRIDLMPDGTVVPCKKFPEFKVGNMRGNSLKSVWHGEDFKKFRATLNNRLMPICSKCELLYSNGF